MPESRTATATFDAVCTWVSDAAPTRWIPTGTVSPVASACQPAAWLIAVSAST